MNFINKTESHLTEMYSALEAEVVLPSDPTTMLNKELLGRLKIADQVLIIDSDWDGERGVCSVCQVLCLTVFPSIISSSLLTAAANMWSSQVSLRELYHERPGEALA